MKQLTLVLSILLSLTCINVSAQESIEIQDINLTNLGDGQLVGHRRDADKTPINGKTRIINGYTNEYINAEFSNGFATGKWEYFKNSKLRSSVSYVNGYQDGEYIEVTAGGTPQVKGYFTKGKKTKWETSNSEGDIKQLEIYDNGDLVKKITYYTNGNIDTERNYKNGKEDGLVKQYTLDGNLKTEKNYVAGKQFGKQVVYITSNLASYIETSNYNERGKQDGEYSQVYAETKLPKVKGFYKNGQKDGTWIYYNMKDKKDREEIYDNGVLKEKK